ncbi:MAG: hypothetical protein JXR40_03255, partial [Pontiellaceae bacterium]|nr:hypothetical protein [Pontiellaceae bacterium]
PRQYGNNLYYTEFRNGAFYRADGTKIKSLSEGPLKPSEAECVYEGSQTTEKPAGYESVPNSAWCTAISMDSENRPVMGYTLYLSNDDHRYRMAFWDGTQWIDREVAYGGKCLYPAESSYTGLIGLSPSDPSYVAISTDVEPNTGEDHGGKHEIYTAEVTAGYERDEIQWKPVTHKSKQRNIRPMFVEGDGYRVLVWLTGDYKTYTDYDCDAVGVVLDCP